LLVEIRDIGATHHRGLFFTQNEPKPFGGWALRFLKPLAGFKGWAFGKEKGGEGVEGRKGSREYVHPNF